MVYHQVHYWYGCEATAPNLSYFSMKPVQEVCVLQKSLVKCITFAKVPAVKPFASYSLKDRETNNIMMTSPHHMAYTKHLNIKHTFTPSAKYSLTRSQNENINHFSQFHTKNFRSCSECVSSQVQG